MERGIALEAIAYYPTYGPGRISVRCGVSRRPRLASNVYTAGMFSWPPGDGAMSSSTIASYLFLCGVLSLPSSYRALSHVTLRNFACFPCDEHDACVFGVLAL